MKGAHNPMLIGQIYLTNVGVQLRDVDGTLVYLTAKDALDLADWLNIHRKQLEQMVHKAEGSDNEPEH